MKIAIACANKSMDSSVETHFGKAHWFCICDTKTKEQPFLEKSVIEGDAGSGCHMAKILVSEKIEMVIARSFNIKVSGYFRDNNVQMITPHVDISADKLVDKVRCF